MKSVQKTIYVYANWGDFKDTFMGVLTATPSRGNEIFSFEYDGGWLQSDFTQIIDPNLDLYQGSQYLNNEQDNFGLFLDSSPDRWGRLLMRRRESVLAKKENRKEKKLVESDYLLGVFDKHRMGGLRFKLSPEADFLNDNQDLATPPFARLRDLEFASLQLEKDDAVNDIDYMKWLNLLMAPGSSLGGARPKASVIDTHGNLFIAKFPSGADDQDKAAWEMVAHDIACDAKLNMAHGQLKRFSSKHHTYLSQRFDRNGPERIHFSSAMTMLGYTDGNDFTGGCSYLDIVEFLQRHGNASCIADDLKELWQRIVLNILISNCDDHLRNHGFILTKEGWQLSPAFDINADPYGTGLKLNITENNNGLDLDLALEVAPYFRLKPKEANAIMNTIRKSVSKWPAFAKQYGISKSEQDIMKRAFQQ